MIYTQESVSTIPVIQESYVSLTYPTSPLDAEKGTPPDYNTTVSYIDTQ